jgi:DNA-binding CsgD family transcriptional regulator
VATAEASAGIVGRERELALLWELFGPDRGPIALAITGGAGLGKTTLWQAAVDLARSRGMRVLSTRPSGAEARLSFAALVDLFDGVGREALAALPAPQLHAVEVAILRADPTGVRPDRSAISVAFLNALRALAARERLLVAVDDVQWLDRPSAEVLAFAARRLGSEGVGFVLARRAGRTTPPLERALESRGLQRLEAVPLTLGAIRHLLSTRVGLALPRHVIRRVFEAAAGNPLFALELGRVLAQGGLPEIGEDMRVPDAVEDLLGTHVDGLSPGVRRLLLAVAVSAEPRLSELALVAAPATIDEALDESVVVVQGDRVRAAHPLLAAAVRERARASERRDVHLALAAAVEDGELRARHLALATTSPDAELAPAVAEAAAAAGARGAVRDAVVLAEHALRLTPAGDALRAERVLALAAYLTVAGEPRRVNKLLAPELSSLAPGPERARAELLLADAETASPHEFVRHVEAALAESGGDASLRARALAELSGITTATSVQRIEEAEGWALEALEAAPAAGPEVERQALIALAWARSLRGRPIDDLLERFHAASDAAFHIVDSVDRVHACRLAWRGEMCAARDAFGRLLELAEERGEAWSSAVLSLNLCDVAIRSGDLVTARRLVEESRESADRELVPAAFYDRSHASFAVARGLADEAERAAAAAVAAAEAAGEGWQLLQAMRYRGIAALLAHEPGRAVENLGVVWEHTQREGVEEPGAFAVAPDLVEALVELGGLEEAVAVLTRLEDLAERQEHPWGLATARRCRGVLGLAGDRYEDGAAAALAGAADDYGRLGLRLERGRALLSLGRAHRRLKKWGGARRSLEAALAAFDEIEAPGWAAEATSELARVSARRPQPSGELTPAERRVAELATQGLSNKEIARTLFVTVSTVEAHLSHAYAKLGVRSRTQLAARLLGSV